MANAITETRFGRSVYRFLRVVGGTVLGQAASAAIAAIAAYEWSTPEGVLIGTGITAVLVAIDKYFRDRPTTIAAPESG